MRGEFPILNEEVAEEPAQFIDRIVDSTFPHMKNVRGFSLAMQVTSSLSRDKSLRGLCFVPVVDRTTELVHFVVEAEEGTDASEVSRITSNYFSKNGVISGISRQDGQKLRHECVCLNIDESGESDALLDKVFNTNYNKTPDFIYEVTDGISSYYLVIEVSTVTKDHDAMQRFSNKVNSYSDVLMDICDSKSVDICLVVLIVSPTSVLSNVYISEDDATDLSFLWKIGEQMYQKGLSSGLFSERDYTIENQLDEISLQIKREIASIPLSDVGNKELTITEKYINYIIGLDANYATCKQYFETAKASADSIIITTGDKEQRVLEFDNSTQDYIDLLENGAPSIKKFKSVVNVPLIYVPDTGDVVLYMPPIKSPITNLQFVWKKVMDEFNLKTQVLYGDRVRKLAREALCNIEEEITELEQLRKATRKSRESIKLIDTEYDPVLTYFQSDGLWKKGCKDPGVLEKERVSRVPLSFDSSVEDISEFLKLDKLFDRVPISSSYTDFDLLIEKASTLVGNKSRVPKSFFNMCMRTKWFSALELISDVATELMSDIKTHIKKGHVIVKKLPKKYVFMCVYPTKSSEHIFVSLFIPKTSFTPKLMCAYPWRNPEETEAGWFYPMVSFKQHKLKNLTLAPAMFINMASFWCHYFGVPLSSISSFSDFPEEKFLQFVQMVNFNMLVFLEDKNRTEEIITLYRYVCLDMMNATGRIPIYRASKIFQKFPKLIRGRLELFIIKKMIWALRQMTAYPPEKLSTQSDKQTYEEEDDIAKDRFKGVINYITGAEVLSGFEAVQLFYIGYSVNKEKKAEKNTEFLLVDKIIATSTKVKREDVANPGVVDPSTLPKQQQFSAECIKFGAKLLRGRLINDYGRGWQQTLESKCLKQLSLKMTHEIATLKASCSLLHDEISQKKPNVELFKAKKVLETVCENLSLFGLNPFCKYKILLEQLELLNCGIIIKLFKKSQHGGLREISILEIRGRVAALFIETLARTICREFDNEILTHPENKLRLLEQHKREDAEKKRVIHGVVIEACNSSDKTQWNQNLLVNALIIPLLVLLPSYMHGAIQRTLNLWVNKHIVLSDHIVNLLKTNVPLHNTTYQILQRQFQGDFSGDFLPLLEEEGATMLTVQSGMQQGILHFLSSLLHMTWTEFIREYVLAEFPDRSLGNITSVVSSDDSATIISTVVRGESKPSDILYLKFQLDRYAITVEECSRWFCMLPSWKSLIAASGCIEFNSEFIVANTVVTALIKYPLAALNLSESENFLSRFNTMYNQLTDVFSKGLPAENTMVTQLCQAFTHYLSLGMRVGIMFNMYSELLLKAPDPQLGFFCLDTEMTPGVIGFEYSHYHTRLRAGLLRIPNKCMSLVDVVTDASGYESESFVLKMGDNRRFKSMVNKVSGMSIEECESLIEENPKMLYLLPRTEEENKIKLIAKVMSPGVANSLKHGDEFVKAFSSSVYNTFTHCFTKTLTRVEGCKIIKEQKKVSLIGELSLLQWEADSKPELFVNKNDIGMIRKIVPNSGLYDEMNDIFQKLQAPEEVVEVEERRMRKCLVVIANPVASGSISLLDLVRHYWFDTSPVASPRRMQAAWDQFLRVAPWLSKDMELTLSQSRFSSHMSLFYFISSEPSRIRRVMLNCPPIRARLFTSQILSIAKRCRGTNTELASSHSSSKFMERHLKLSKIYLSTTLPSTFREETFNDLCDEIEISSADLANSESMHYKEAEVMHMLAFRNRLISNVDLINYLLKRDYGLIVSYIQEQVKTNDGTYVGYGEVQLANNDIRFILVLQDSDILLIKSNGDADKIRKYSRLLEEKVKELRVNWKQVRLSSTVYSNGELYNEGSGTPFIRLFGTSPIFAENVRLRVLVEFKRISVMQQIGGNEYRLSYVNTHDLSANRFHGGLDENRLEIAWIESKKLTIEMAKGYLGTAATYDTEVGRFLAETFRERFSLVAVMPRTLIEQVEVIKEKVEVDFASFVKQMEQSMEVMVAAAALIGVDDSKMDNPDPFGVQNNEVNYSILSEQHGYRSVMGIQRHTYMAVHPLWDNLIEHISPRAILSANKSTDILVNYAKKVLGIFRGEDVIVPIEI
jgi:ribosome maturation factor RimP